MPDPASTSHDIPESLPILPLVNTVVFPASIAALKISGRRSLALLESLGDDVDIIGLFCPKEGDSGELEADDLLPIGVAARIVQRLKLDDSRQQILFHGLCRVELRGMVHTRPHLRGRVEPVVEPVEREPRAAHALVAEALEGYRRLAHEAPATYTRESVEVLRANADFGPAFFSDLLASLLEVPVESKRRLLTMSDPRERLGLLLELLEDERGKRDVERDIQEQVESHLEVKKREFFLREQMRTIQKELGEAHVPRREAQEYAAMIDDLPLDDDSKAALARECESLSLMSPQSAEYPVQSNYLDTVFRLPWWEQSRDRLDLGRVERILGRRHYGLQEVKDRLLEYLSVIKLKGHIHGPILCLAGPPGTGKTSLARSIAAALGRTFVRISLGGVADESEIRGHRKTYVGAMPGKIIAAYDRAGSRNPVILLDEIDKLGRSGRGDPAAALLEVLDPEQNHAFSDHYLGVPFDLSDTLFIATANVLDAVPKTLRDRLEVLSVSGYTEDEKVEIARRFMRPRLLEEHGLERADLRFSRNALVAIIRGYTAEAGLRELERQLASVCRKVARRRAASPTRKPAAVRVRERHVEEYLGPVRYEQEFAGRNPEVGLATGLAWTGEGGAILFIEASRMAGTGKVEVTGHLGEVMMESVRTAYSYVRAHARELEIADQVIRESDVHLHFPAGAIPKDGPSAGIAAATCLASLLSGRPVRHDVAMSGEITLRGKILSVGGIKEKVLAAHRARIRTVLLPFGNKKDLARVPAEVLEGLEIVLVNRVEDVWRRALVPLLMADQADVERYRSTRDGADLDELAASAIGLRKPKPG